MNKSELKTKYMKKFASSKNTNKLVEHDKEEDIEIEECSDEAFPEADMLKSYKYLYQDELQNDVSMYLQSRRIETYKINIVGFRINDDLKLPFMEFLFLENDTYVLPDFDYFQKDLMIKEKDKTMNDIFTQRCYDELEKQYEQKFSTMKYIGFKNVKGVFYAFIYIDESVKKGKFILYDEIRYTKSIYEKEIDQYHIFMSNNINQLQDNKGKLYDAPMIGYLCKRNEENKIINIELKHEEYEETMHDEQFGDYFIFSESPLKEGHYKRYAIFMSNMLFYFQDDPVLKGGGDKEKEDEPQYDDYNSIYYYSDNAVYYYVKSLEQFSELL